MKTLIVASTQPYAGKSGISLALLTTLADRGLAVGYFKPYGTMPIEVDGVQTDADAAYIAGYATAKAPLSAVCPIVESRALVEDVLAGEVTDRTATVATAFEQVSQNADIVVVEGPSSLSQGRALGLNLCALADQLDARVLLVDRPVRVDLPDRVLWAQDCLGERLVGVVFNAVHESIRDFVAGGVSDYLAGRAVRVLGTIPRDPMLSSASVAEIVEALGGTVLSADEHLDGRVESFMVGAMGQDKALRFFRRRHHKAVITGGDRADVQLAALETDTRCIILTGNLPPSSLVLSRAEELGVPMILVGMDTLTAVEKMETLLGRVRLHDPGKAARIREMFAEAVDVDRLLSTALDI